MLIRTIYKALAFWSTALIIGILLVGLFVLPIFVYFGKDLPDYKQLTDYDPPTISRIYSSQGDLMAELAIERRIYRKIDEIPQVVINAFISAEDQNYYNHPGIDLFSIARAALQNIANIGSDRNPVGGSTITQQVVKNFLLTNERSLSRKVKEAILAYRINTVYSKDRILELYLNQIYLGNSAYGVTSAALNYFNKDLKYVTIEEAALIAALPKAPSMLDPTRHPIKAKARRDWVLDRMHEEGYISSDALKKAKETPIKLATRFESSILDNGYYTESVRLELIEKYGFDYVYQEGLSAFTNLDKTLQKYADDALRNGLVQYDHKRGYRGPIKTISIKGGEWKAQLNQIETPDAAGSWRLGVVLDKKDSGISVGFKDGNKGLIPAENFEWAKTSSKVLKAGDVILVGTAKNNTYTLEQVPQVNGAIVVMQPKTGKVLAMSGGYSFKDSKYNRALQALRQPGSIFKPFVYLAALEKGYGPTSIVKDEPISISQGPDKPAWTPKNYEGKFLGEITMRKALEKSRNLATVYLIKKVGTKKVAELAQRFGVYDSIPPAYYSMALGSVETTLLNITSAYATFASDGMKVKGKLLDRVQDRKGNLLYTSDNRLCDGCGGGTDNTGLTDDPKLTYSAQFIADPVSNYQLLSMLRGVVERGTATRARALNKILAGKTGTSNESFDTWFIGFSPDLVVGVFVGYDNPKSLGAKETGASLPLPIFIEFMGNALKDMPNKDFVVPDGIQFNEIDYNSGTESGGIFSNTKVLEPIKRGAKFIDDASDYSSSDEESSDSHGDGQHNFGSGGVY